MKKIYFLILCICLLFLVACNSDFTATSTTNTPTTTDIAAIEIASSNITLNVGEEYMLEPHITGYVADFTYTTTSQAISVSNKGLVTANFEGTANVYITAKNIVNVKGINVLITVVDNTVPESYDDSGELKVYFIDVGQADCIFIILPNNETMMIDAGLDYNATMGLNSYPSWDNITSVLDVENITTINHLVISHNHADHYYYIPNIINNYDVKHVYASGSTRNNSQYYNILRAISNKGLKLEIVSTGDKILNYDTLMMQVVATRMEENEEDPNINTVMLRLVYKNNSFMFTGDAGSLTNDGEIRAVASGLNLQADVLKVGHHGSPNSSSTQFLNKVSPRYAVITTANETQTGHPYATALRRILATGAKIYQSKDSGTILFTCDGTNYQITEER